MCSDILSLLPKYHILHKFYYDDKRKGNSKTNEIEPSRRRRGRGITNELRQYVSLFPRLLITNYLTRNQQIYDVTSSLSTAAGEALKRIKVTSRCDMGIYIREFMRFPDFAAIKRQTSRESFERS